MRAKCAAADAVRTIKEIREVQRVLKCGLGNVTGAASMLALAAMLEVLEWAEGGTPEPFTDLIASLTVKYPRLM